MLTPHELTLLERSARRRLEANPGDHDAEIQLRLIAEIARLTGAPILGTPLSVPPPAPGHMTVEPAGVRYTLAPVTIVPAGVVVAPANGDQTHRGTPYEYPTTGDPAP